MDLNKRTEKTISFSKAQTISGILTLIYVSSLYIIPGARSNPTKFDGSGVRLDRFHPRILRFRLLAISLSTIIDLTILGYLIKLSQPSSSSSSSSFPRDLNLQGLIGDFKRTIEWIEFSVPRIDPKDFLRDLIEPLILTMSLFWGPIYSEFFLGRTSERDLKRRSKEDGDEKVNEFDDDDDDDGEKKGKGKGKVRLGSSLLEKIDIYTFRNLILGPLLEEIVFRGCLINLNILVDPLQRLTMNQLIFLVPLWFGLAHVHSFWESYQIRGKSKEAFLITTFQTCFQFTYTTIFGWYSSLIYLRTGSIVSTTICHSFCNFMGFPNLISSLDRNPLKKNRILMNYSLGIFGFFIYLIKNWIHS